MRTESVYCKTTIELHINKQVLLIIDFILGVSKPAS